MRFHHAASGRSAPPARRLSPRPPGSPDARLRHLVPRSSRDGGGRPGCAAKRSPSSAECRPRGTAGSNRAGTSRCPPCSLARLSDALRLTAAERAYLFELSRRRDPSPALVERQDGRVPAELRAVLQATARPGLSDGSALACPRLERRRGPSVLALVRQPRVVPAALRLPRSRGAGLHLRLGRPCRPHHRGVPRRHGPRPRRPGHQNPRRGPPDRQPHLLAPVEQPCGADPGRRNAALPPSRGRSVALRADHPGSGTLPRAPRRHAAPANAVSDA